jgi:hypothetical protein
MKVLPESPILGALTIQEVFVFYDIPLLFSCKDQSGQIYIVVSLEDKGPKHEWLYSPVTSETMHLLRKGEIDFYSCFRSAQNNFVYRIITEYNGPDEVLPLALSDVPDDWLPGKGEGIDIDEGKTVLPYGKEATMNADPTGRGALTFALNFKKKY